jgi:hypothetical protein
VRKGDLAGLQTGLVDDVALGGQVEPDGGAGVLIVVEEVVLASLFHLLLGSLLDVCQKSL